MYRATSSDEPNKNSCKLIKHYMRIEAGAFIRTEKGHKTVLTKGFNSTDDRSTTTNTDYLVILLNKDTKLMKA